MTSPDEQTLDLWLADALSAEETAGVDLQAALALDGDELAYLADLQLAQTWRTASAASAPWWGWIAVIGVVAGFAAWVAVGPTFGSVFGLAIQVGVGSLLINAALGLAFTIGQVFLELIRNPLLGWSQPLLALCAVALLVWPRQLMLQRSTHA
jgi:hypothetical protein